MIGRPVQGERGKMDRRGRRLKQTALAWGLCLFLTLPPVSRLHAAMQMEIVFPGYTNRTETLTNFPVLLTLSNNVHGSGFNYDSFLRADGYDLRFSTNIIDTAFLDYEIELWDTNGTSYVWVKIPELNPDGAGSIRASWGLDSEQPPCATNGATWENGYHSVWHMGQGNGIRPDSAGSFDGTVDPENVNSTSDGKIGPADVFTGTASGTDAVGGINCGNVSVTGSQTIEMWVRAANRSQRRNPVNKAYGGEGTITFETDGRANYYYGTAGIDGNPYQANTAPAGSLIVDEWLHMVHMRKLTAPTVMRWYINGVEVSAITPGYSSAGAGSNPFLIGKGYTYCFNGIMDEVRISSTDRSADWVWACWLNQASNTVFCNYRAMEYQNQLHIRNRQVTNVTSTSASFNGWLIYPGGSDATVSVLWGEENKGRTWAWANTNQWPAGAWGQDTYPATNITGLATDRTYYYTFAAFNATTNMVADTPVSFITGEVVAEATDNTAQYRGNNGAFTVTRPATATDEALTVYYTMSGTASNGADYAFLPGSITIPAGADSATISLNPLPDADTTSETAILTIAPGTYPVGTPAAATITIQPADSTVMFWIGAIDQNWSVAGNWLNTLGISATPDAGNTVVFYSEHNGASIVDSNFNGEVGAIMIDHGYTNTITQNRDLRALDSFDLLDGMWTYTTETEASLTVDGNMTVSSIIECPRSSVEGMGTGRVFTVGGNLTITTNGVFDAQGKGFNPGNHNGEYNPLAGPGQGIRSILTGPRRGSGGGHGGRGGYCTDTGANKPGGSTYGSLSHPLSLGSGGGGGDYNPQVSYGGGAIALLVAGDVECNGLINANAAAEYNNWGGGGSGGSIFISCGELQGAGVIHANGGDVTTQYPGGGGGGRIAIHYTAMPFSGTVSAFGGRGVERGAAGTVYLKSSDMEQGMLLIDNNNYSSSALTDISTNTTDTTAGNVLIRNNCRLSVSSGQTLTVTESWTNNGAFVHQPDSTVILASTNEATITGNNTFENLTCTNSGKRIVFEAGNITSVSNILTMTGSAGQPVILDSSAEAEWFLRLDEKNHEIRHVNVRYSNAGGGAPAVAFDSVDSGDNVNWVFASEGNTNTWIGTVDSDWTRNENWDLGRPAIHTDSVVISADGSFFPMLDFNKRLASLKILPNASMSLGGFDLTVEGATLVQGTLTATGLETLKFMDTLDFSGGAFTQADSTVVIGGNAAQSVTSGGIRFHTLLITNTAAEVVFEDATSADVIENQAAIARFKGTVTADIFNNNPGSLWFEDNLAADWFNCRNGPAQITFNAGSIYSITNMHLYGSEGNLITLRSSTPGNAWLLNAVNCRYVSYVDARDSNADGGTPVKAFNSIDSGNNTAWTFIAPGVSLTWNGSVSSDFNNSANWSPAGAPGPGSVMLIDGYCPVAPVISEAITVSNMFIGGPLPTALTINAPLTVNGDLAILQGSEINHTRNTDVILYRLEINISGDLLVDGLLNADGKGYAPGTGPEPGVPSVNNTPRRGSGGGHGGQGGACTDSVEPKPGGSTYGSITNPVTMGSGGGWGHYDPQLSYGGGAIKVVVDGDILCDGMITAGGATNRNYYGGGGAGGSILLSCGDLKGTGFVRVNGGDANTQYAGGGGGGRIALYCNTDTFDGMITAFGGNGKYKGAAGTVYLKTEEQDYGTLVIDNNNQSTTAETLISSNVIDAVAGDVLLRNQGRLVNNLKITGTHRGYKILN